MFFRGMLSTVEPFFFFNDTATTEIYTLSLHDALPICVEHRVREEIAAAAQAVRDQRLHALFEGGDRKSTRLNSSHLVISYAVFCLKKKRTIRYTIRQGVTVCVPAEAAFGPERAIISII